MTNIEKYIVKVRSETGEGSGFLMEGGYIVTANHNIRDGKTTFFILNELTNKFNQELEIDNLGFVPIRKAKGHCRASQAVLSILSSTPVDSYCLINSWEAITEAHLENWFDQFCRNIARASDTYLSWLKDHQQLKMAVVEKELQDLIIEHNPDYQHLHP